MTLLAPHVQGQAQAFITQIQAEHRQLALDLLVIPFGVARLAHAVEAHAAGFVEDDALIDFPASSHPAYRLLSRRPNDWMTSFEFRQVMMFHAALLGNGCAYIGRVRGVPQGDGLRL